MQYYLLTGATGLLGNYLVRDLLQAGRPVAVVVRANRKQSARQRMEVLLSHWDDRGKAALPRPVVLEGDIAEEDLGLDANDMRWVAEYCGVIIHNAASLSFQAPSPDGEPYRSNVLGTQNVLEFARTHGIREFHHVSTAYVAGLRQGRVLESDVDVGQELSNDYEKSKLAAEKLVRAADFLDAPTVFRPGIIVGDSKSGYTTTYHGFYAALQLAHTLVKNLVPDETGLTGGQPMRLALDGDETKHLVPVDWVSAVMTHVITTPSCHGKTYHLTPRHPVTSRLIRDVLEQAVGFYGAQLCGSDFRPAESSELETLFHEHIRVYNSYWRMDPVFDRANTEAAAAHLPCPELDRTLLMHLSRTAIDAEFPTPSKKPIEPEFDAAQPLLPWLELGAKLPARQPRDRLLGLDVRGMGGGQWQLVVQDGLVVGAEIGIHADRLAICRTDVATFADLAHGRNTWEAVFETGSATLIGNGLSPREYAVLLDQVIGVTVG